MAVVLMSGGGVVRVGLHGRIGAAWLVERHRHHQVRPAHALHVLRGLGAAHPRRRPAVRHRPGAGQGVEGPGSTAVHRRRLRRLRTVIHSLRLIIQSCCFDDLTVNHPVLIIIVTHQLVHARARNNKTRMRVIAASRSADIRM